MEGLPADVNEFLLELGLGENKIEELVRILMENEITDLDTMCLLSDEDWEVVGVKLGLRRKIMARLTPRRDALA